MIPVPADRAVDGGLGERLAEEFLRREKGYRILRRNCRTRSGEIDLVARDGDEVVFVEVKTRSGKWDAPEDAVNRGKQRRLCRAAQELAARHKLREYPLRFDVVAIVLPPGGAPKIEHFVDAFTLA